MPKEMIILFGFVFVSYVLGFLIIALYKNRVKKEKSDSEKEFDICGFKGVEKTLVKIDLLIASLGFIVIFFTDFPGKFFYGIGGTDYIWIFFIYYTIFEVFRAAFTGLKLCDTGLDKSYMKKITRILSFKIILINIVVFLIFSVVYPSIHSGGLKFKSIYSDFSTIDFENSRRFIIKKYGEKDERDCSVFDNRVIKKERYDDLIKRISKNKDDIDKIKKYAEGIHEINGKYVYIPLTSVFLNIKDLKKTFEKLDNDLKFYDMKRSFKNFFYYFLLLNELFFLGVIYFFVFKVDEKYFEYYLKKKGVEESVRYKVVSILRNSGLVVFSVLMILAGCVLLFNKTDVKMADGILINNYSNMSEKKFEEIYDRIKELNIRNDEELSDAIKKGEIYVSSVLDSTLTVQIEDSRLDENIKKELLNYYRQNYEKYRYRIINGYLIDFIHGKYRRISRKKEM